jgi:type II secretory pathway pseudopilin PulG
MRRARISKNGFTLVEALVSLTIVCGGIVLVAEGFSVALRASVIAQKESEAVMLARSVMAKLESGEQSLSTGSQGTFDEDRQEFTWITTIEATELPTLKKVTVAVDWPYRGETRSVVLTRLMRDRSTGTSE